MNKKTIVTEFLRQVWSEGDVHAVEDYVASHYTIHHDTGDPWEGQTLSIDDFKDRLVKSRSVAPDQVFTPQEMVESANKVAVAWTWRGTHLGEVAGIPPTGRLITMSGMTIYYFDSERLSGHWQIADRLGIFQQISSQSNSV